MTVSEHIPLRVVVPFQVWNGAPSGEDYGFTTSVVEPVAAWNSGTAYAAGARVSVTSVVQALARRGIYRAVAATTGEFPPDFPAKWVKESADEVNKPFDGRLTTGAGALNSATPGVITYTFTSPKRSADTLVAYCGNAYSARVRVLEAGTAAVVYDRTVDLIDNSVVIDAWTYFFAGLEYYRQAIFEDLPAFVDSTIELTLTGQVNPSVLANEIVIGASRGIGRLTSGGRVGIEDYSRKERDTFGNFNIIQRAYSDFVDFGVALRDIEVDAARRYLAAIRALPCVYHAGQDYVGRGLIAYGFYKELAVEFTSGPVATCTLSIEGLT